jgi:hypothetical protein
VSQIFEILNALSLPRFKLANWCSTTRDELAGSKHYANLANRVRPEVADIIYLDTTGALTQYL